MSLTQEEVSDALEHRDVILDVRAILATTSGKRFFKYLFKSLEVNEVPAEGLPEMFLRDKLGFLRAGNSIFKLVAEADFTQAGQILAQIEKDNYDKIYAESHIGQT